MMFALPAILQQGGETIDPLQPRFCGFNKTPTFPEYELVADPSLVDPYWINNILYLTGVGANGSQSFVDSSINPKTLATFGTIAYSNTQAKYNGSSIFNNTSSTSYIQMNHVDTLNTFTIECWFYFNANANNVLCTILSGSGFNLAKASTNLLQVTVVSSIPLNNVRVPLLKWNHVAVTRVTLGAETISRVFFNGFLVTQRNVASTAISLNNNFRIGSQLRGFISNVRITKNVDRYSAYFNPETATYMATPTGGTTTIDYYTW